MRSKILIRHFKDNITHTIVESSHSLLCVPRVCFITSRIALKTSDRNTSIFFTRAKSIRDKIVQLYTRTHANTSR